jgi:hypothetical protein
MTSEWVFRDRFKCKDDVYKRFGDYEKFIENYAKYTEIQTISTTDSKIKFDSNWSKGMPRDENRGKSIYFN